MQLDKYYPDGNIPTDIQAMLQLAGHEPTLEDIWALMDLAWVTTKANPENPQSMDVFYAHPVWLLNGFFTEWHKESVHNREEFAIYISKDNPKRIADFGGGFAAFARVLAEINPHATIEVVEPYPTEMARTLSKKYHNIQFVDKLTGKYDVITALDVLEHVTEPLELAYHLAEHVNKNGYLLLANCFYPVIKCHLPCTFYLRHKFDFLLEKMGLVVADAVLYGKKYIVTDGLQHPGTIKRWCTLAKIHFVFYEDYQKYKLMLKSFIKKIIHK